MTDKPWEVEGVSKATWYRRNPKKDIPRSDEVVLVTPSGEFVAPPPEAWEADPRTIALKALIDSLKPAPDFQSGTKVAQLMKDLATANAEIEAAHGEIARLKKRVAELSSPPKGLGNYVAPKDDALSGPGLLSQSSVKLMSPAEVRAMKHAEMMKGKS